MRGEGVEIQHSDARAIIRQDQGGPALPLSIGGDQTVQAIEDGVRLLDIFMHRRSLQRSGFERRESGFRGIGDIGKNQPFLRQFEGVRGRRIFEEIGKPHKRSRDVRLR